MIIWSQVTNWIHYFSTCKTPTGTRLGNLLTQRERLPSLKSHDPLINWSTFGHMTNWKKYIFTFAKLITTKLGRVLTSGRSSRTQTFKSSPTFCLEGFPTSTKLNKVKIYLLFFYITKSKYLKNCENYCARTDWGSMDT